MTRRTSWAPAGDGVYDTHLEFTSTLDDANAALATLRYVSWSTFAGTDGVSLVVDDLSNGGIGAPQSAFALSVIEVQANPNALPRIGAPVYVSGLFEKHDFLLDTVPGGTLDRSLLAADHTRPFIMPSPPQLPDQSVENNLLAIRFGISETGDKDNPSSDPQPVEESQVGDGDDGAGQEAESTTSDQARGATPSSSAAPWTAVDQITKQEAASGEEAGSQEKQEEDEPSTSEQIEATPEASAETGSHR